VGPAVANRAVMDDTTKGFGAGARAAAMAGGAILMAGCIPTLGFYSLEAVVTVTIGTVLSLWSVVAPASCERLFTTAHGRRGLRALGPVLLLLSSYRHALDPQPGLLVAPFGLLAFILLVVALLRSPEDESPLAALLPGLAVWSPTAALLETRLMYVERSGALAWMINGWLAALLFLPLLLLVSRRAGQPARIALLATILLLGGWSRGSAIVASPDPVIDVYSVLDQTPKALLRGENPYRYAIISPYGTARAQRFRMGTKVARSDPEFYTPGILLICTPTAALNIDPRWWLVVAWMVAGAIALRYGSAGVPRPERLLVAYCLALVPSASFATEQAWIDPVAGILIAASMLPLPPVAAGILAAFGVTVKQTALALVPAILIRWRRQRTAWWAMAAGVAAIIGPFLLWDAHEFLKDCFLGYAKEGIRTTGICFPALVLNLTAVHLPTMPLTLLGMGVAAGLAWLARDSRPRLLAACGVGLAVVNLLNKWAFLNYYEVATMLLYLAAVWPARREGEA